VYKNQVDRLTDIVRTSVDCSSFASINAVVQVSSSLALLHNLDSHTNAIYACVTRVNAVYI
jgi:hypothetical protein